MDFKDLIQHRRSHRMFSSEEVSGDDISIIMRAALMSPTSKNRQQWQFVVIDDKLKIEQLSDAKSSGSKFLESAPLCIAVLGNPQENDCWIEDCSIAAHSILLQTEELGLGACWIQIRNRWLSDGTSSEDVVRGILGIPENIGVLCLISIGHKAADKPLHDEDNLKWEQVSVAD